MGVMTVSPARLACSVAIGCLLGSRVAMAFPATDPASPSVTVDTPEPTESDLRHQLQALALGAFAHHLDAAFDQLRDGGGDLVQLLGREGQPLDQWCRLLRVLHEPRDQLT